MDAETAERLIELNRDFYTRFSDSFSATRQRIQPGVRRVLDRLDSDESILDLGCGNGEFERELAKRGHKGPYLGVDSSLPLLRDAELLPVRFPARFLQAELSQLPANPTIMGRGKWEVVTAFSVLHHIPSTEIRLNILRTVRELLAEDGQFILSNWQFLNSEKLSARIQDWSKAGLTANDVDPGDYLLDWRSSGEGLRYVHQFSEEELSTLAASAGFIVRDMFYSDGEGGNLGLYQVWEIDSTM